MEEDKSVDYPKLVELAKVALEEAKEKSDEKKKKIEADLAEATEKNDSRARTEQ